MAAQQFFYPGNDFERARVLLGLLGSFWARTYTAVDQVSSYAEITGATAAQSHRNLLESVAALSRYEVPLYHTEHWTPLTVRKSQMNAGKIGQARFDIDALVFNQSPEQFNRPIARTTYAFPKPAKLAEAPQIFNKLLFPTAALTENVDYALDTSRNAIVFIENPFDNPGFLRRAIYAGNQLVDEEITIWIFHGKFDYDYVFTQFGYALGVRLSTSQGYKDLMNAVFSGLVSGGAAAADLDLAFSAICGVPVALDDRETVETMQLDAHGLFIATDKNVYRFAATATPVAAVGDILRAGAPLIDALQIYELTAGQIPAEVSALALDNSFLATCFYSDLVFENKNVPLEVNTAHPSGYTYVSFGLGGFPADVTRFFDELHMRGVEAALKPLDLCDKTRPRRCTLAHYLDKRAQPGYVTDPQVYPVDEPGPQHLPSTINPLQFIVANILRNNVFLVRIKGAKLGQNRLGLYNIRHLRQLLPPGAAMIVIYDLGAQRDTLDGTQNLTENLAFFTGAAPKTDTVGVDLLTDKGATVRVFSGTCQ